MSLPAHRKPLGARGVAIASLIGTTIEWYDFYVYATSVVLVLGSTFFPASDPLTTSLLAFSTLGVGFLARPIGGLVFAHFGDRVGRKHSLVVSLFMMGGATTLVGLLPTYAQIGVWAPILLVALRFVQGLAVGGEWGGAVVMSVEHAPARRRAFFGSFPQFGSPLGMLGSAGVIALFQLMPADAYAAWGWRMPFLLSVALLVAGLVIRLRMEETPQFTERRSRGETVRVPVVRVLRSHWRAVLVGVGMTFITHASYLITSFLPSYAKTTLGVPPLVATSSIVVASACAVVVLAVASVSLDKTDRRFFTGSGGILFSVSAFPVFYAASTWGTPGLLAGVAVGYMLIMPYYGALASMLNDLFPPSVRYTGISLCYQLSAILGGGLLPILTSYLVGSAGGAYWPAAALATAAGVVTLVASVLARPVAAAGERPVVSPTLAREHNA